LIQDSEAALNYMKSNKHVRKMRHLVRSDFMRHIELNHPNHSEPTSFFNKLVLLIKSPGFFAVLIHRLAYLSHTGYINKPWNPIKYLFKISLFILKNIQRTVFKISIDDMLTIGPGLVLSGYGKIIVGAKSIGANCTLLRNVTIGIGGRVREKPAIGNNVYLESNAIVFGRINIGNNVVIKAGSVCSKNIPDGCIVDGNPARIINRQQHRLNNEQHKV
jgi:serine acetyltransferase